MRYSGKKIPSEKIWKKIFIQFEIIENNYTVRNSGKKKPSEKFWKNNIHPVRNSGEKNYPVRNSGKTIFTQLEILEKKITQ